MARFETDFGDFKSDLGGSFQVEDIQPQKRRGHHPSPRHQRQPHPEGRHPPEYGLNGKFEFNRSSARRYGAAAATATFNSKDNGHLRPPRRQDRDMRFITVSRPATTAR